MAAAAVGVAVAFIAHDGIGAALIGLAQASLALAVGLGLDWSTATQATVMTAVSIAVGMWDRTQVRAPLPEQPKPTVQPVN